MKHLDLALFSLASLGMGFGVGQWREISESDLLLFVGNIALRAFWMFLMAVVLVTRAYADFQHEWEYPVFLIITSMSLFFELN